MASWPVGGDQSGRGGGAHNQSLAYLPLPTRHFNEPSIAVLAGPRHAHPLPPKTAWEASLLGTQKAILRGGRKR
ncbi:hypothetical protein E2C01_034339 [Portunus trituberculatus]|uniref:Uncharacterized protein n=1 Tax=Portunus trituberculatus TaxID=210409 RepID=A0A5B7F1C7_PORTR|nr:hypothetical protein [Portunus trituberculatus]